MYQKDFDVWNVKKKILDSDFERPYFHQKEIWFCYLGQNVGYEQDGRGSEFQRPVLVFRKFSDKVFWGIPLSKSNNNVKKKNLKFYYAFNFVDEIESVALLSQIRLIDAKRLARKIGFAKEKDFGIIIEKLKGLMP